MVRWSRSLRLSRQRGRRPTPRQCRPRQTRRRSPQRTPSCRRRGYRSHPWALPPRPFITQTSWVVVIGPYCLSSSSVQVTTTSDAVEPSSNSVGMSYERPISSVVPTPIVVGGDPSRAVHGVQAGDGHNRAGWSGSAVRQRQRCPYSCLPASTRSLLGASPRRPRSPQERPRWGSRCEPSPNQRPPWCPRMYPRRR